MPICRRRRTKLRAACSPIASRRSSRATPIAVGPATPVGDVLRLMVERKIGCVLVAEGPKPVGIFSERDALRKINDQAAEFAGRPVSDFMTPNPQTLMADAKIAFAVQRMDLGGFRHLPIVDCGGHLIGVISARDILAVSYGHHDPRQLAIAQLKGFLR